MWQWDELEIIAYQIHCDLGGIQFLQLEIAIQKVSKLLDKSILFILSISFS